MDESERRQYNSLTENQRKRYDFEATQNPDFTHKQLITIVGLDEKTRSLLKNGCGDITVNDPKIMKEIWQGVSQFLTKFPDILIAVFDKINRVAHYLDKLIDTGRRTVNLIGDIVDEIKSWF